MEENKTVEKNKVEEPKTSLDNPHQANMVNENLEANSDYGYVNDDYERLRSIRTTSIIGLVLCLILIGWIFGWIDGIRIMTTNWADPKRNSSKYIWGILAIFFGPLWSLIFTII